MILNKLIVAFLFFSCLSYAQTSNDEFFHAVEHGKITEAKEYIASGADINATDNNNFTPLFYALLSGNQEMVKILVTEGANLNAKNCWGQSPLIVALDKKCSEGIIRLLIQNGAEANVVDNYGITAIYKALAQSKEMCKILVDAGATFKFHQENSDYDILFANSEELISVDKIMFAVQNGLDLNKVNSEYGFTALHHAIGTNKIELVRLMIKNGANVNAQNSLGETPLHESLMQADTDDSQAKIVALLLASGADPNIANNNGNTPVEQAVKWELDDIIEVFENAEYPINK